MTLAETAFPETVTLIAPDGSLVDLACTTVVHRFLASGIVIRVGGAVPGWPSHVVAVERTNGRLADVLERGARAEVLLLAAEPTDSAPAAVGHAHDGDRRVEVAEVELFGDHADAERVAAAQAAAAATARAGRPWSDPRYAGEFRDALWAAGLDGAPGPFPVTLVERPEPYVDTLMVLGPPRADLPRGGYLVRPAEGGILDAWAAEDANDMDLAAAVRSGDLPPTQRLATGSWTQMTGEKP